MVQASRLIRSNAANTSSMPSCVDCVIPRSTAPGSTAAMTFIWRWDAGGGVIRRGCSSLVTYLRSRDRPGPLDGGPDCPAIRNGRTPTRTLKYLGACRGCFWHSLREDDALAIASYLKTLPPVRNQIARATALRRYRNDCIQLTRPLPAALRPVLTYARRQLARPNAGPPRDPHNAC